MIVVNTESATPLNGVTTDRALTTLTLEEGIVSIQREAVLLEL